LEETGYMPKQKYSSGVEIRTYIADLVESFGFDKRVLFRSQLTRFEWDEGLKAWYTDLTLCHGLEAREEKYFSFHANFLTLASGVFPYPKVPKVSGLVDFEGQMFHTSRWNYNVTEGLSNTVFPKMEKLERKRVGIIGTEATDVQLVPQLARYAKELYVFQRTPSQVNAGDQRDTDPKEWREEIASKPGWQKHQNENLA
jgi:cation diffusion facilitator CzcD-associated flavoprotein CzcO